MVMHKNKTAKKTQKTQTENRRQSGFRWVLTYTQSLSRISSKFILHDGALFPILIGTPGSV